MDIDTVIAEHGWALQAVLPDGPGTSSFAYTIGLFDRLPELLCVGPPVEPAAATVDAVAKALQLRPDLAQPGRQLVLDTAEAFPTVKLGAVASRWQELYVGRALDHHRRDDLELLQVLAPDGDGRFPDEPGFDPTLLPYQPVLADPDRPWQVPHGADALDLSLEDRAKTHHAVLLPIIDGGLETGREELVAAIPESGGWRLTAQPSLADWCAIDSVVAAVPAGAMQIEGRRVELVRFEHVVRASDRIVLRRGSTFRTEADLLKLLDIVERPRFAGQVSVGLGVAPHALTFAVPPRLAEPLRSALRHLERDGLLVPRSLFHEPEDGDLAVPHTCCPHCQTARSAP